MDSGWVRPRKHVLDGGARWRHLANTTERSASHLGQGGAAEGEEVHPLNVAGEATDLDELLELVRRQRQAVPPGLNRGDGSQHLRTELHRRAKHTQYTHDATPGPDLV